MIRSIKILLVLLVLLLSGCSNVLQTVDLKVDNKDKNLQENFNVIEKTLTFSEARRQNLLPYYRKVLKSGRGENSGPIPENRALLSNLPENKVTSEYKLGVGDTLSFSKLIDNRVRDIKYNLNLPPASANFQYKLGIGDELTITQVVERTSRSSITNNPDGNDNLPTLLPGVTSQETEEAKGRVGPDGSVVFIETGRIDAAGKTLTQIRSEIRNLFIRNGTNARFQLEITEFRSQRAYLTINSRSEILILNDQQIDLRDALSRAGKGLKPGILTRIRLQRDGKNFNMRLRDIFSPEAPKIIIQDRDHIFVEDSTASTNTIASTVGQDGFVVLASVGKIKAKGKTLNEIQDHIASLLETLPDSNNAFQIEISSFASQKALINIPGQTGGIVPITSKPVMLDEVITESGLSVEKDTITRINLQRNGKSYSFTLDSILAPSSRRIKIEANDRIVVEILKYKPNKVFILGGVSPQIFNIDPAKRETLADILFTGNGVLGSDRAKRSEVYLLRGKNPVFAYHLDAQNPARLLVAEATELRPNDILFVAEQPIISFNRTLATIVPLRILLRDIQDDNIP